MTHELGTLHTHFQRTGLFIVILSEQRIGLRSIDNGLTYYINKANFSSQYTPLTHTSDVSDI